MTSSILQGYELNTLKVNLILKGLKTYVDMARSEKGASFTTFQIFLFCV